MRRTDGWQGRVAIAAALLCVAVLGSEPALAQHDEVFMAAREAFRLGNRTKLDQLAPRMSGHALQPYVAYWRIRQRIEESAPNDVRDMIAQLADGPLSDRLRNDWLKVLGKRGQWESFQTDQAGIRSEDVEVTCYGMLRGIAAGEDEALRQARAHWLRGRPLPDPCGAALDAAYRSGAITPADVWTRARVALQQGQVALVKAANRYLPDRDGFDAKALDQAASNPRLYLERHGAFADRADRETFIFALLRLARSAPQDAAVRWRAAAASFTTDEKQYVWGQLAYWGTMQHDPEALAWFAQAGKLSDTQLEWRSRAALRVRNWQELVTAVDAMSEAGRAEPEWRYWKARALKIQGRTAAANALLAPLSNEHGFYGLLASSP